LYTETAPTHRGGLDSIRIAAILMPLSPQVRRPPRQGGAWPKSAGSRRPRDNKDHARLSAPPAPFAVWRGPWGRRDWTDPQTSAAHIGGD